MQPFTEEALHAYVDGQMALEDRAACEAFLAAHPEVAARVLADIGVLSALRATETPLAPPPDATVLHARRLSRGLSRSRWPVRSLQGALAASLVAFGWLGHATLSPVTRMPGAPSEFVEQAIGAAESASIEQQIAGRPVPSALQVAAAGVETDLDLPSLPANWTVDDVQVYPWVDGHGVMVSATAGGVGEVRLFAAAVGSSETVPPTVVGAETGATIYWQIGATGYTLMGDASPRLLKQVADRLTRDVL